MLIEDLKTGYNCNLHPKAQSGDWTSDMVFNEFAENFLDGRGDCINRNSGEYITGKRDGIISRTVNFY